jgi:uncharacterized membrane protein
MTKHRLELFSDGVFAIILTLLVLELKPPEALGLVGFREIAPALMVHAATFGLVGVLWVVHHNLFAVVEDVRPAGLGLNLLTLFWLTLLPFASKVAAAHPLDSLGPSLLAGAYGLYTASLVATRLVLNARIDTVAGARGFYVGRLWQFGALAGLRLALAGLAWVSPWFGYAAIATVAATLVLGPAPNARKTGAPANREPQPK